MIDLYQILGVPRQASTKEIRAAFKRLAVKHHPDKNPGNIQAEERFKEVNAAYQVLSDEVKKWEYDKLLAQPIGASTVSGTHERPNTGRARSRQRRAGAQYRPHYRPKKEESSEPLMTPLEIFFWLGGGIALMALFIWGLSSTLGFYEARSKFEKAQEVYYRDNAPVLAVQLLSEAINRDDEFGDAYELYGKIIHEVGGDPQQVVFLMNKAFQFSDSISADLYFLRAEALSQLGAYDEAIADLLMGLQFSPEQLEQKEQLAELKLYKKHEYAESIVLFDQILASDSTYHDALLHKGVAFYRLRQYPQSNEALVQALDYNPKNGAIFLYMGLNEVEYYLDTANACNQWLYAAELGVKEAGYYIRNMCK